MSNYNPLGYNPADAQTIGGIFDLFMRQFLGARLAMMQPVVVVSVDGAFADVRPVLTRFDTRGQPLPITDDQIIHNVPICQPYGARGKLQFQTSPGDHGLLFACNWDASNYKASHTQSTVGSARQFNWSDGFFLPVDFQTIPDGILISDGASIAINPDGITATAPTFTINGDVVITGTVNIDGAITANSTITATGEITGNGVALSTHTHGPGSYKAGNTPVSGMSAVPTPSA
ncbi:MAG: hypothetical protein NC548_55345 [Lachnospiraceae bacterium]|nr:hypothetical protein [Lachnospiraceae bacterium]